MKHLSSNEIEEILSQDFNLSPSEIDRYKPLFSDDYAMPRISRTIRFINSKSHMFKDRSHKRNTILKKLRELHDPLLNVYSINTLIQKFKAKR